MAGLKQNIQKDVFKARPESLVEAFALGQFYEKEDMSMDIVRCISPQENTSNNYSTSIPSVVPMPIQQTIQHQSYMPPHKRPLALPPPSTQ